MIDNHAIFVGGKPFMNYVTAVVMQFTTKGADNVTIRSRGKFISRAVDVAEVVKSRFLRDQIDVSDIQMGSEEFKNKEGRTVRVSTLDISLGRIAKKEPAPAVEPQPVEQPVAEPQPVVEVKETPAVVVKPIELVEEKTEEETEETEESEQE
jgi:archaea-specific DNA-binding protein